MYSNKYSVTWIIRYAIPCDLSSWDKEKLVESKDDFNAYYTGASRKLTRNKKYIRKLKFNHNKVTIYFETEHALLDLARRGNALRQFSRILSKNGFDVYVYESRLMRAA